MCVCLSLSCLSVVSFYTKHKMQYIDMKHESLTVRIFYSVQNITLLFILQMSRFDLMLKLH